MVGGVVFFSILVVAVTGRLIEPFPDGNEDLDSYLDSPQQNGLSPVTVREITDWPKDESLFDSLGQVPGMAICPLSGKLNVFARRDVVWDGTSFDESNNKYKKVDQGPIKNDTVIQLDPETGLKLKSWGSNLFYMPHGITIDQNGSIWVTDVALHQVMKFSKDNLERPILVLGEKLIPGNDESHFCKPTDVAVSSKGYVYISDGYCNSRIVILDPMGKVVGTFDIADGVDVPHSVTLLEQDDLICVADREFRRIPCYTAGLSGTPAGKLVFDIRHPQLGRVFAIDHLDDLIFAVNGPDYPENNSPQGVVFDLASHSVLTTFSPASKFFNPHDICVSSMSSSLFVSEIDPRAAKKIYKFAIEQI